MAVFKGLLRQLMIEGEDGSGLLWRPTIAPEQPDILYRAYLQEWGTISEDE